MFVCGSLSIIFGRTLQAAKRIGLLTIQLRNSGLAPAAVDYFIINRALLGHLASPVLWLNKDDYELVHGQELPATIAPNSSLSWIYDLKEGWSRAE